MLQQPGLNILYVQANTQNSPLAPFIEYLRQLSHVNVTRTGALPGDLGGFHAVLTERADHFSPIPAHLEMFTRSGGLWFSLTGLSTQPVDPIFGVVPGSIGPEAELRVLFKDMPESVGRRLSDGFYINGFFQELELKDDDVDILLAADWHFQHSPLLISRRVEAGHLVCTTVQDFEHPDLQKIAYRLIRTLSGVPLVSENLSAGILGYAPSVGELHGRGIELTPGLMLSAVCDLNPAQLTAAADSFPEAALYDSSDAMAEDESIDLVIIATPPSTHAVLSNRMMTAGKHVVCEKPLAIHRSETDLMQETADRMKVHLSCHQNRRFDQDFLAIRQAVMEGRIGDLFYMETFVGGFFHPCGHWHSHVPVSGGTAYDWGAHYLDWTVGLIPDKIDYVSGTSQKRVWHDITNSDHEHIRVVFQNKTEAVFTHSDIAAIRKPKWYLLGTKGAIAGYWRDVTAFEIDPLIYYEQHDIPATEMPPDLRLKVREPGGKIIEQKMALPRREKYPFHSNIADHLLLGEPLAAPLEDSVKVVSILEAASMSSANNGKPEYIS